MIILLLTWSHEIKQEFQWLEFYAGVGRLTTMMHASEYRSARFDLLDNDQPSYRKSNFMDLTHSSGYALAILFLLRADPNGFASHFGVKCSSFSKMNVGTSQRSACAPVGHTPYKSVALANKLLERTCGLILLVTALGGAWSVEQPNGSLLEFYPLWRETIQHIFECGHEFSVQQVRWWMAHYSSRTAKRHYLYANPPAVLKLDKGKLVGWKNKDSKVKSAVKYVDGSGKQRYKGTEHLRATEIYPVPFARAVVDIAEEMKKTATGQPELPRDGELPSAFETFRAPEWPVSDLWGSADFIPVYNYLRRYKKLVVPDE
ncbi:Uncharacterized protein SCF082_LOCUS28899 [Durusdinium trenchii]|uniref:Methyltransferase n=1 Tax=Durusdinium trenchii TaxID=1381693 RepID=A0ABP0MP61_9DINO